MHSRVMEASMFTDCYEILEISRNANSETIERIFRYLALRYHPDNQDTGDLIRFGEIVEAPAITNLNACQAVRVSIWGFISGI
jgi:curved DNA-binding protein CbpA